MEKTQITFGRAWSNGFEHFKSHIWQFILLFLIFSVPQALLQYLVSPIIAKISMGFWISLLVSFVLSIIGMLLSLMSFGSILKGAITSVKEKTLDMGKCISYTWKRLISMVFLTLRVFFYTMGWLLIPLVIFLSVNFYFMYDFMMGQFGIVPVSSAQEAALDVSGDAALGDPEITPEMEEFFNSLGMEVNENGELEVSENAGSMMDLPVMPGWLLGLNLFLIFAIVVLGLLAIYRSIRTTFAFQAFFDKELTTAEAMKESKSLTRSRFWRLFGYILLIGLIMVVIMLGWSLLMGLITAGSEMSKATIFKLTNLLAYIPLAVVTPFIANFGYALYKGIKEEGPVSK